jgi:hypothetical protein
MKSCKAYQGWIWSQIIGGAKILGVIEKINFSY